MTQDRLGTMDRAPDFFFHRLQVIGNHNDEGCVLTGTAYSHPFTSLSPTSEVFLSSENQKIKRSRFLLSWDLRGEESGWPGFLNQAAAWVSVSAPTLAGSVALTVGSLWASVFSSVKRTQELPLHWRGSQLNLENEDEGAGTARCSINGGWYHQEGCPSCQGAGAEPWEGAS